MLNHRSENLLKNTQKKRITVFQAIFMKAR